MEQTVTLFDESLEGEEEEDDEEDEDEDEVLDSLVRLDLLCFSFSFLPACQSL